MTIYGPTFAVSRKVEQIKKNNKNNSVHTVFGAGSKNWELPYVNVVGTAVKLSK